MNVAENHVVSMHYTLKSDDGTVIDKSEKAPLSYLHGAGQIVIGLEKALQGKKVGDQVQVKIDPDEGYGPVNPSLVMKVPKEQLKAIPNLHVGQRISGDSEGGTTVFHVRQIADDHAVLDANHPLAGMNLNFDVEVTSIRAASEEELSQGQACSTGCCD